MVKALFGIIGLIWCFEYISCVSFSPASSSKNWYQPQMITIQDAKYLDGKKVVLDPGHGNQTSGAVGLYGTKESDINLSVAKILKKQLESHGAKVFMTRESDTTALWSAKSTAREDLAYRCVYRDSLEPDLFVSLHHNGTENDSRDVNVPKIFYAQGDPDGSLDAAVIINAEFSSLLGLGQSTVHTGNYFVLRKTTVPSIIGEPSYLSHPEMEKILGDSAALALEAMAYFRGIVKWFSGGVPKIISVKIDSCRSIISTTIKSDIPLDSQTTGIYCNQNKLSGKITGSGYTAVLPGPLANGKYTITCFAGNRNGNLATRVHLSYEINRSPSSMIAHSGNFPVGSVVPVTVTVLDNIGFPVRDGTPVIHDTKDTVSVENGIALCYHRLSGVVDNFHLQCDSVVQDVDIMADTTRVHPFQGFIRSVDSGFRPRHCLISCEGISAITDNNGFFSFLTEDSTVEEVSIAVSAKGYVDTSLIIKRNKLNSITISPRSSGILFGKTIVIDPEFGGVENGGVSKTGARACDITRKVSNYIVSTLEEYGAYVLSARDDDRTIHVTERVLRAQNTGADLYILIRADSTENSPYIACMPGSAKGKQLSDCVARCWKNESALPVTVQEKVMYVLQQTECPAVALSLSPLNDPQSLNPQSWRRIARTAANGIIEYYKQQ